MNKSIEQVITSVINLIKNLAMVNNFEASNLFIIVEENSVYVNGDGISWKNKLSQEEIEAIIQELIKMGAVNNKYQKNMAIFNDPSLLLSPKKEEININYKIINSVINTIKDTAMVNNSEAPVLYVTMDESSIYVNGDGASWNYKFSQEEINAVMQELINMGATINEEQKNMVIFNDPSLLLNQGRKK